MPTPFKFKLPPTEGAKEGAGVGAAEIATERDEDEYDEDEDVTPTKNPDKGKPDRFLFALS